MPTRYIGNGYWEIVSRQMSIVSRSQQQRFKDSKVAVIGCGGIGGSAIEMLARMGVGQLTLVDYDYFDLSNLNRQVMSSLDVLRKDKSEVTKEKIRLTNPYVEVKAKNTKITEDNIKDVIGDVDIIIDALDNLIGRITVSRYAKKNKIPFIHGAINGTKGQITVFTPECGTDYEKLFGLPSLNKELTDEVKEKVNKLTYGVPPVIGPTPNIIGNLESFEAFKYITGIGEVIEAPKVLTYDLLNLNTFSVNEL